MIKRTEKEILCSKLYWLCAKHNEEERITDYLKSLKDFKKVQFAVMGEAGVDFTLTPEDVIARDRSSIRYSLEKIDKSEDIVYLRKFIQPKEY